MYYFAEFRILICVSNILFWILTFVALNLWITSPSNRTNACWMMLNSSTFGILYAWISIGTWISANLIDTRFWCWTLTITLAFWCLNNWLNITVCKWITNIPRWTSTNSTMIICTTFRRSTTWIAICAWIHAITVLATFKWTTITVWYTSSILKWFCLEKINSWHLEFVRKMDSSVTKKAKKIINKCFYLRGWHLQCNSPTHLVIVKIICLYLQSNENWGKKLFTNKQQVYRLIIPEKYSD